MIKLEMINVDQQQPYYCWEGSIVHGKCQTTFIWTFLDSLYKSLGN
jgi:hypothetical protein